MLLITTYCTIVITYLISTINNIKLPISIDYFLLVNICFLSYYFLKHDMKIFHNKKADLILSIMLVLFVFYQLFNIHSNYIFETIVDSGRNFLTIINIYMISMYMYYNKCEQRIIIITYFIMCIFIIIMYGNNFDNFAGLKALSNVFDRDLRYRNSFGLFHENAMGNLCYISLILSFYILKNLRNNTLILRCSVFFMNIVILFVLTSTSSRTSITSLILFLIIFYMRKMITQPNIDKAYINNIVKVVCVTIGIEIFITVLINFIYKIKDAGLGDLIDQTNRLSNFEINIPILYNNNKELVGVGLLKVLSEVYGGTNYLDNWYLYMFVTTGYIGLTISIIFLFIVSFYVLHKSSYTLLEEFTIAFFISQLYYNLFETFLYNDNYLNSFILWIFIFITIFYKYQGDDDNKILP